MSSQWCPVQLAYSLQWDGRGPDECRSWRFQLRSIMSDLTSQISVLVHISFLESEISLSISFKSRHIWSWLLLTSIAVGGWQTQKLLYIEQMINKISFQHSFCKINMPMYVNTNPQSRYSFLVQIIHICTGHWYGLHYTTINYMCISVSLSL